MGNWLRWLVFGVLAVAGFVAVQQGWLGFLSDKNLVASYIHSHGVAGLMEIILAGAVFTGVGAPRQLLAFVLGYALDGLNGTLLSTLSTALGATGCFFTSRWLLRTSLTERFGQRMRQFDDLFRQQTLLKVLMVRLLPVGSNLVTNLVAGCSEIRFAHFLAGSTLGYLPQMLVFALAGAGVGQADHYELLLSITLFIIASAIGAFLYHSHRAKALASPVSSQS
ncbi:TVP38/TMEM64 family protein [Marinobacter sp. F4218]|uniref:TVP38/TMEM64 family protein n=1 Tax=Marinobacter sp. F4218 TaxID=2862868 RepID=UPI001C62CFD4|nr:VTT domain-containing protein [Marinobacter sp. F4218]MBW7472037.1 VTT domain-containing protein [Marinobacter sp. F4218]